MLESDMTDFPEELDFVTWLMTQAHRDDVVGDLATDLRIDMDMGCMNPANTTSQEIREHLLMTHEVDEDVIAFIDFVACEHLFGNDASTYNEIFDTE